MQPVFAFIAGIVLAFFIFWLILPRPEEPINWEILPDSAIVEKMEEASLDQVAEYVEWVHAEPLPANYVIPAHVANSRGVQRANAAVHHRYPQFDGKHNEELLAAVKENPLLYQEYIQELLSVGRMFGSRNSPNS